jgi:hypothetical protein
MQSDGHYLMNLMNSQRVYTRGNDGRTTRWSARSPLWIHFAPHVIRSERELCTIDEKGTSFQVTACRDRDFGGEIETSWSIEATVESSFSQVCYLGTHTSTMLRSLFASILPNTLSTAARPAVRTPLRATSSILAAESSQSRGWSQVWQGQQRWRSQLAPKRTKYRKAHKGRVSVSLNSGF